MNYISNNSKTTPQNKGVDLSNKKSWQSVNAEKIPQDLKDKNQWLLWKGVLKKDEKGAEKWTKVPYSVYGKNAKVNDAATWSDFQTVFDTYQTTKRFDGIGFVMTDQDNIVGIDIDHCIDLDSLDKNAEKIIQTLDSYTEFSPSRTGIRIFCKGTLPPEGRKKGNIEMYNSGRYLTVTGQLYDNKLDQLQERTEQLLKIHSEYIKTTSTEKKQTEPPKEPPKKRKISTDRINEAYYKKWENMSDDERIQKALNWKSKFKSLHDGEIPNNDHSAADMALCNHLAYILDNDSSRMDAAFRNSKLYRQKWDKKHSSDGRTYGQMTIDKVLTNAPITHQQKIEQWQFEKHMSKVDKQAVLSNERKAKGLEEVFYYRKRTDKTVEGIANALAVSTSQEYVESYAVYRHGSFPVSVVTGLPKTVWEVKQSGNSKYPKMPIIKKLTIGTLKHSLQKAAVLLDADNKNTERKWPNELLTEYIQSSDRLDDRALTGIVEHPYINDDFSTVTNQGYDPETGLYKVIDQNIKYDYPEITTPQESYKYLLNDVFADFLFASELDAAGAVSVLLTAMQRKMINDDSGAPGFLFDAPIQSSGKTTLAQVINYSIYGRPAAVTSWTADDTEMSKLIISILEEGQSSILFDNIPQGEVLENNELAKAMTSRKYSTRLLKTNDMISLPTQVVWMFTGNNLSIAGDFNTRILSIRLDPFLPVNGVTQIIEPDRRTYKRSDIGKWCLENRGKILSACMTIIKASKDTGLKWSRFRDWDNFVRFPIYIASKIDIAELFERNKFADLKFEGQRNFLETWYNALGDTPYTSKKLLEKLNDPTTTALREAIIDIFDGIPNSHGFSRFLTSIKGRVFNGYRLNYDWGTNREAHYKKCWKVEPI